MSNQGTDVDGRRRLVPVALLVAVFAMATLVSSCSDDRSLADWEATWQETRRSVPSLAAITSVEPGETCSTTLGMLREASEKLITAPNQDLADAFLTWSDFAEGVFFECPPVGGNYPGFEASYEEMERLASEVDALIAFEHDLIDGR